MSEFASLEHELRALRSGVRAPDDLHDTVLAAIGLRDSYAAVMTPLGTMFVAWNAHGVSLLRPARSAKAFAAIIEAELGRRAVAAPLPDDLAHGLQRHFAGDTRARVPVDLRSRSPFERSVLESAARIPRGSIKPYAWIAERIGNPRAVRAVGTALGKNPVPLIIPCHRVVRGDGAIGSYIFGTPKKVELLRLEGAVA